MKNLENLGAAPETATGVAEMELEMASPSPFSEILKKNISEEIASEDQFVKAVDASDSNGVDSSVTVTSKIIDTEVEVDETASVSQDIEEEKKSEPSELNGVSEDKLNIINKDSIKEKNGEILNDVSESLERSVLNKPEQKTEEVSDGNKDEDTEVNNCDGNTNSDNINPDANSSPDKVNDNTQEVEQKDNNDAFKMPNSIEELLDEEVLKDDPSDFHDGVDREGIFNDLDTSKEDSVEDMEVELSKVSEANKPAEEKASAELEITESKSNGELSVAVAMEVSDTEKLMSEDKCETNKEESEENQESNGNKDIISPFVDETSPESDDDLLKGAEKKNSPISTEEDEKPSQISLETLEQGSDEENSDDDLDINAGLDKCFSALEKEISKDDVLDAPKTSNSLVKNLVKIPEEIKKDIVKTIDVDDSSRETMDVSNVPSEAEEGGNEADDEDDKERMSVEFEAEEPVDLDQALGELEQIEKTTRRILDDESESLKRPSEESSEPASKKVKVDQSLEETVEALKKKKLKKELKRMSRNDLEDLIANKMVEVMTNKSEIGKLRHQCDSFQETVEKWKRRAQALSKQCTDLSTVMRKYITDSKNRPRDKVAPVRITRSVGLQVMTPDQRRLQQQRQNMNRLNRTQDKAVAPGAVQQSTPAKTAVNNVNSHKLSNGLTKTASPQLPRTVGGTTISPAKAGTPLRNNGSVTITQTKTPTPSSTPKPVIDVVDLSDDESTPVPPPPKPAPAPVRQVSNNLVRSGGPRQQGQQFIMQGNQLYPVRQNMARQLPGHRPMMGSRPRAQMRTVHPAPLPPMPNPQPNSPNWKLLPPRPALKISRVANGIVLSWNMNLNLATHATIASYQLYAYQESAMQRPDSSLWKKVGDVKALPLPMACTLTQFTRGNKYHFAVRAMDGHSRVGQFSDPNSIVLN